MYEWIYELTQDVSVVERSLGEVPWCVLPQPIDAKTCIDLGQLAVCSQLGWTRLRYLSAKKSSAADPSFSESIS